MPLQEENHQKDVLLRTRLEQVQQAHRRLRGRELAPSSVRGVSPERDRPATAASALASLSAATVASMAAQDRRPRTLGGDRRGWVQRAIHRTVQQREASEHLEQQLRGREALLREIDSIEQQRAAIVAKNKENVDAPHADEVAELAALDDRREALEEELRYKADIIAGAQKKRVDAEAGPELAAAIASLGVQDARELARIALEEAARVRFSERQREARIKQLIAETEQVQAAIDAAEKARHEAASQLTAQQRQHQLDMCFLLEQIQWQNAAPPSDEKAMQTLQLKEEHIRMLDDYNKELIRQRDDLERQLATTNEIAERKKRRDAHTPCVLRASSQTASDQAHRYHSSQVPLPRLRHRPLRRRPSQPCGRRCPPAAVLETGTASRV